MRNYGNPRGSTYRSRLEERCAAKFMELKVPFEYETMVVTYVQPEVKRKYTPDFVFRDFVIEVKGVLTPEDRKKHLWVKDQVPELEVRFLFGNSRNKIYKGSKTTYGDWCNKNGFIFADFRDFRLWTSWFSKEERK